MVAIAFAAAVCIDRLQLLMSRRRIPFFYQQVAGGGVATILALAASAGPARRRPVARRHRQHRHAAGRDRLHGRAPGRAVRLLRHRGRPAHRGAALDRRHHRRASAAASPSATVRGPSSASSTRASRRWDSVTMMALGGAICAGGVRVRLLRPARGCIVADRGDRGGRRDRSSQAVALQGFSRRLADRRSRRSSSASSATRVAGRVRVPPLVVVVSAVVPMLPGPLDLPRPVAARRGRHRRLRGLLAMVDRRLGRDRALLGRDPRGVRRAAAQARGAPRGEPARRPAPGRPAAGAHRPRGPPGPPRGAESVDA